MSSFTKGTTTPVDAIGDAVLEHRPKTVAIDVDADLLLEQIALEVRGEIGQLARLGVRAAAVVVLEDERQVAVLEVDAVDLTVVERLLAEPEREHALAEGGGALGERRSRDRAGDLPGVVEMTAPRRRLREGRDLLGDADVQQRRRATGRCRRRTPARSTVARKSLNLAASAIAWGIRRDAGTVGGVS